MIRFTLHYFYQVGKVLQPLTELQPGKITLGTYNQLYVAAETIDQLLRNTLIPLRTSRADGQELLNQIDVIIDIEEKLDDQRELGLAEVHNIKTALETFETVLSAELSVLDTYFVSQKGCYSTYDLIMNADKSLPSSARSKVPQEALDDLKSAGRCLAFELPTAFGFHIIRAVESMMREYYRVVVGTIPKKQHRNWGAYLKVLREQGANEGILFTLGQMKAMHRDPLMHPEQIVTMDQAVILFGLAQGVILEMVNDKEKRILEEATLVPPELDLDAGIPKGEAETATDSS